MERRAGINRPSAYKKRRRRIINSYNFDRATKIQGRGDHKYCINLKYVKPDRRADR
jgi:hypothetical protein